MFKYGIFLLVYGMDARGFNDMFRVLDRLWVLRVIKKEDIVYLFSLVSKK